METLGRTEIEQRLQEWRIERRELWCCAGTYSMCKLASRQNRISKGAILVEYSKRDGQDEHEQVPAKRHTAYECW